MTIGSPVLVYIVTGYFCSCYTGSIACQVRSPFNLCYLDVKTVTSATILWGQRSRVLFSSLKPDSIKSKQGLVFSMAVESIFVLVLTPVLLAPLSSFSFFLSRLFFSSDFLALQTLVPLSILIPDSTITDNSDDNSLNTRDETTIYQITEMYKN